MQGRLPRRTAATLALASTKALALVGSLVLGGSVSLTAPVLLAGSVLLTSCGPSVQVLHEGSVRFEHCYRLDLDPAIAPLHRKACWKAWQERYSYGQSRDRLEYADRRVSSIERGDPPPGLKLDVNAPRPAAAESPIDPHAPPPSTARPVDGITPFDESSSVPRAAESGDAIPGDVCAETCREGRRQCLPTCQPDQPEDCGCETKYRACMVGCFR
jgi:hypothetical protein